MILSLKPAPLLFLLVLCACRGAAKSEQTPAASSGADAERANAAVQDWRGKHEIDYRRDFVTIAGLHPLRPGANTAGSSAGNDVRLPASVPATIGSFVLDGTRVTFRPSGNAAVLLRGQPVTAEVSLRNNREKDTDELTVGNVRLVVHVSGDRQSIRVRDPDGELARGFKGFSWFSIDAAYRTKARFIRDPQPRRFKVPNTYGDIDEYTSEGVAEFELLGRTLRLRPFSTRPGRLYFVFRDASSGQETYETARFLYADLLDDGTALLDFNMAYNPPCAFNPYTTCPIPLPENRLPVKVLAGEKGYAR